MQDSRKTGLDKLYDALTAKGYAFGSREQYDKGMQDADYRRELYNFVSKDYNLGSFEEYEAKVAPKEEEKETGMADFWKAGGRKMSAMSLKDDAAIPLQARQDGQEEATLPDKTGDVKNEAETGTPKMNPPSPLEPKQEKDVRSAGERFMQALDDKSKEWSRFHAEEGLKVPYKADERNTRPDAALAGQYRAMEADREQVAGLYDEITEAMNRRGMELDRRAMDPKNGWMDRPRGAGGMVHTYNSSTFNGRRADEQWRTLAAARNAISDARKTIEEADRMTRTKGASWWRDTFVAGAARGFGDKFFDLRTWDYGISELSDNLAVALALDDFDKGKPLAKEQEMLLDALSVKMATDAYFGSYLGRGYKAGAVTAESLPFMLEMMINPAAKIGSTVTSKLARYAIKRFGKAAARKLAQKAVRAGARVAGDAVGSAVMAGTTGAVGVTADALDRMTPNVEYAADEEGKVHFTGHDDDAESPFTAFAKAFGARTIENHSEMIGNYFAPIGNFAGKMACKGLEKVGLGNVGRWFTDLNSTRFAQMLDDFQGKTHWDGVTGEFAEEVVGGIENALVVGDQTLDTDKDTGVFNRDNLIDTFLGVGLMSGIFSAMNTASYRTPKYRARQQLDKADNLGGQAFGEKDWGLWKGMVERFAANAATGEESAAGEYGRLSDLLYGLTKDPDGRQICLDYLYGRMKLQGMEMAQARKREEANTPEENDLESSYENGRGLQGSEMHDAQARLEQSRRQLKEKLDMEDCGTEILDDASWLFMDREQQDTAMEYLNAKATWEGMTDGVRDEMSGEVESALKEIEPNVNRDDNALHPATTRYDHRKVYIVKGVIATDSDGNIDLDHSDESIIVRDAVTGEIHFAALEDIREFGQTLDPGERMEVVRNATREGIATRAARMIDGILPFEVNDEYELTNGKEGTVFKVRILPAEAKAGEQADPNMVTIGFVNGDGSVTAKQDVPKAVVQEMSEANTLRRLNEYEKQRRERQAAMRAEQDGTGREEAQTQAEDEDMSAPEGTPRRYEPDEELVLDTPEGEVRAVVSGTSVDNEGHYQVETERPVNGKRVQMFTQAELDRMVKAEETPAQEETAGYSLSEETDENGHPFVVSSDGSTTFGQVREESGLPAAPIKLSEGYQGDNGMGYGLVHIEANHGKQIKNAGFASVEDFVSYVAKNYDEDNIRVGKRRENGSITYLLQVTDKHDNTLFVELSRDGSYWNVNSAGIFRKGYSNKKETVVKTEPQQPNNASSAGSSRSADESGGIAPTAPNGKPTVSTGKGSNNGSNVKTSAEKACYSLTEAEAKEVLSKMEEAAEVAPEVELTPENWTSLFGEDGKVDTPVGTVKMGENQYFKLAQRGRDGKLGMVKPTLEHPDAIVEDERPVASGQSERAFSYVFVKTFRRADGSRYYYFTSVTVSKDGKEVVVSNQEKTPNRISKLLQQGKIAWIDTAFSLHPKAQTEESVPLDDSNRPTSSDNQSALLGIGSSEHSTGKGSNNGSNVNGVEEKKQTALSSIPVDDKGEPLFEQAPAAATWAALVELNGGDKAEAKAVAEQMSRDAQKAYRRAARREPSVKPGSSAIEVMKARSAHREELKALQQRMAYWGSVAGYEEEQKRLAEMQALQAKRDRMAELRRELEKKGRYSRENALLGDPVSFRDYAMRAISTGAIKFVWGDDAGTQTKGLASHLGLSQSSRERNKRIWLLSNENGMRPERAAETLMQGYAEAMGVSLEDIGMDYNEALDEVLDILSSYDKPRDMFEAAKDLHKDLDYEEMLKAMNEDMEETEEGTEEGTDGLTDSQGNPINEDGTLKIESVESVDELTDEDFTAPTRNVRLPKLPRNVDAAIGADGKPVIIKKNIFGRNAERHPDISASQSREILESALYNPDLYGQNQKAKRPYNWVVINTKDENGKNRIVLLEVNRNKDNIEIVHWHYARNSSLEQIKKQVESEGGLILILPSDSSEEAGGLPSRTLNLQSKKQAIKEGGPILTLASAAGNTLDESSSDGKGKESNPSLQADGDTSAEERSVSEDIKAGTAHVDDAADEKPRMQKAEGVAKVDGREAVLRDAVIGRLRESGMEVITDVEEGQRVLDMADGRVRLSAKKRRALETASLGETPRSLTVVSSADGAKVLKNIDALADVFENSATQPKTFIGDVAKALGARRYGSASEYATFEAKNGKVVTIRLSDHNAKVSNFDYSGNANGISIVISPKRNGHVTNDGNAHIVEYYYDAIKLRRADGKPLADIVRSIKQALYSGEFEDTTGLAERQEVNGAEAVKYHRVYHGSGADFTEFDHSHMGEGEGAQAYGWGTYVTEVEGIGRTYAEEASINADRRRAKGRSPLESAVDAVLGQERHNSTAKNFEQRKEAAIGNLERIIYDYGEELKNLPECRLKDSFSRIVNNSKATLEAVRSLTEEQYNEERVKQGLMRHLYTVEIPEDNGENYLDWTNPLTDGQIDAVRKYLAENYRKQKLEDFDASIAEVKDAANAGEVNAWSRRGENVYKTLVSLLGTYEEASKALSGMGFTGIKYPAEHRSGGREDGAKNYVIFNEKDAKITDHVRFFRTPSGQAYGFTVGGKIYIDPKTANSETPVHEYAHLWAEALRNGNRKEWDNVVELMKGTGVWEEVKKRYPELETDDGIAEEVLAHYSGRRGAELLREEARKIAEGNAGIFDKAAAISALQRVRKALVAFWKGVADFLHIHYTTPEEVADRVMKDLLDGVDPGSMTDGGKNLRPDTPINVITGSEEHGFVSFAEARDWARKNIARTYGSNETGGKGEIRISNAAIDKYLSEGAVGKSESKDVHLSVLKVLPDVIRESVDAEQHPDYRKGADGERSVKDGINPDVTIHRLYGAVRLGDETYRVKVTLKENVRTRETTKAYSYEATKIELLAGQHGDVAMTSPRNSNNSISAAKLLEGVEKSYGGGRFFESHSKPRFQFMGEKGAENADRTEEVNTRLENLRVAREMESAGKDAKAVKMGTGWERGADGKWRYEMADGKYHPKGDAEYNKLRNKQSWSKELDALSDRLFDGEQLSESESKRFDELAEQENKFKAEFLSQEKRHLADWVENKELFDAYPELKNVEMVFTDQLPKDEGGYYSEEENLLVVNTSSVMDIESVIAHEVQHAIQRIEGFARGGNEGMFRDEERIRELESIRDEIEREIEDGDTDREEELIEVETELFDLTEDTPNRKYRTLAGEVEARNVQSRMGMTPEERRASIAAETEDVAREDQLFLYGDDVNESRTDNIEEANRRFNEQLSELTKENANSKILSLGNPSEALLMSGVSDKSLKLYGNKLNAKAARHGFAFNDLRDLPKAVAYPIAVFRGSTKGSHAILTELKINGENVLVSLSVGEDNDVDFNIVRSVYGKGEKGIVYWINSGKLLYADKAKALDYLRISAPIAEALSGQELDSATKVVENFENPKTSGRLHDEGDRDLFRTDNGTTVSERTGTESGRMAARVRELAEKLHLDNVEIVTDASALSGRQRTAKGFYNKESGKITVVVSNHADMADIERTVLHEAVAHHGLRELFGEHFDTFLDNVFSHAGAEVAGFINEIRKKLYRRYLDREMAKAEGVLGKSEAVANAARREEDFTREATEEYLASLAERMDFEKMDKGVWQRIKQYFMDMLHSLGLGNYKAKGLTDNELRYILWRSYANLKDGGAYQGIFNRAADVARQSSLKVGMYAESPAMAAETIEEANRSFNGGIERWERGLMTSQEYVSAGYPTGELAQFMPKNEIIVRQKVLSKAKNKHGLSASDIKNLPKALSHPIFMFRSKENTLSILTELKTAKGQNVFVAVELGRQKQMGHNMMEINDITTIHGREAENIVNPIIENDSLVWVDKKKGLHWLSSAQSNAQAIAGKVLDSATKVVEEFENPKTEAENDSGGVLLYREPEEADYEKARARDAYERRMKSGLFQSREALQDSMLSLKEAMDAILGKKANVEDIDGFENAYLGENRMSSQNRAEVDAASELLFKPLYREVVKIAPTEKAREELIDYMFAKHGLERNAVFAERDAKERYEKWKSKHPDTDMTWDMFIVHGRDYSGLTALTGEAQVHEAEAVARRMVEEYEKGHDTEQLWKRVNTANRAVLRKQYESGLMGREMYDRISGMFEHYIPLQGFDETTSSEEYAYLTAKGGMYGRPVRAGGRVSKADNPFANMEAMMEGAIMRGNRNALVKQRFLNFVLNHPSDLVSVSDVWLKYDDVTGEWVLSLPDNIQSTDSAEEVERKMQEHHDRLDALAAEHPDRYKRGRDAVNIPYRVTGSREMQEHQVVVSRGGRTYVLTVNGNPRLAQALNGLTNPDNDVSGAMGRLLSLSGNLTRTLSAFYTTRNPDFILSNFLRDTLYSNTMVWVKESPNYALRYNNNWLRCNPKTMLGLYRKYRKNTLNPDNGMEGMFRSFMMNGGETGYVNLKEIERRKKDISRLLKNGVRQPGIAALGRILDEMNRAIENQARFAAFVTSLQMGRTTDRAVYDAKEISVNFNKKGSGGKFVDTNVPLGAASAFVSGVGRAQFAFWNAAIQGTANFARQAGRHKGKALASMAAMFALGCLIGAFGGGDDDGPGAGYHDIPKYTRRSNIVWKGHDGWGKLPLPVEYRAIYGLGELFGSSVSGKEKLTGGELAMEAAGQLSQIMPLDLLEGGGGFRPFIPTWLRPALDVGANRSWTGLPIYRGGDYNRDMPGWTKAYKSTNTHIVSLAETINGLTGGTEYEPGAVDINPAAVEYLLNGYLGGTWSFIDKLVKSGETVLGDREYNARNMPFWNRVAITDDERMEYSAVNGRYRRLEDEYNRTNRLLDKYAKDTYRGVFDWSEKIDFLYNSKEFRHHELFEWYKPEIDAMTRMLKAESDPEEMKRLEAELNEVKKTVIRKAEEADRRK